MSQFLMGGFSKPCRLERNKHRRGALLASEQEKLYSLSETTLPAGQHQIIYFN